MAGTLSSKASSCSAGEWASSLACLLICTQLIIHSQPAARLHRRPCFRGHSSLAILPSTPTPLILPVHVEQRRSLEFWKSVVTTGNVLLPRRGFLVAAEGGVVVGGVAIIGRASRRGWRRPARAPTCRRWRAISLQRELAACQLRR